MAAAGVIRSRGLQGADLMVGGSAFLGTLGAEWLAIEIYDRFKLNWLDSIGPNVCAVVNLVLIALLVASGTVLVRLASRAHEPSVNGRKRSFGESLVESLEAALTDKRYWEVIRIGAALNRPLFESGDFATRVRIGRILEEAAALAGRKDYQIIALIDLMAWSLVERGQYEDAQKSLKHGIELARQEGDQFYVAKALRHLGVIERRLEHFVEALDYYGQSREVAESLEDCKQKSELIGGLDYAVASLHFYRGEYDRAMEVVDLAVQRFTDLRDGYRLNMSMVMKGDIQFKRGERDQACDTYRSVLEIANKNTEQLQIARCYLGLGDIYLAEFEWDRARRVLEMLEKIDLDEFKAEADRRAVLAKKIPAKSVSR